MSDRYPTPAFSVRHSIPAFIDEFLTGHRYAPSIVDIGARFGWASKATTFRHLALLRAEGLIDWVDGQPRTFHTLNRGAS